MQLTMIALRDTQITLPFLWGEKKNIARNPLLWQGNEELTIDCTLYESGTRVVCAKTSLNRPFNDIFLKFPRCKATVPDGSVVLRVKGTEAPTEIGPNTRLQWDQHPSLTHRPTPEEIAVSWQNQFRFFEEQPEKGTMGLRKPQVGAIHAIAAYLSLNPEQPGTVVMPTGTGKTEVMLGTMVCCQCPRVLVLVPSDALRRQLFRKFHSLGCLPIIGAIPNETIRPRVAMIQHGISRVEEARQLAKTANVLIALPQTLSAFSTEAKKALISQCTHLFIDEAHHVAAKTWTEVRDAFEGKHIVQFTATPFRRDGRSLQGKILFNYKLGDAQQAGYFKHIRLHTINECYEAEEDKAIAEQALRVLRADLEDKNDHLLMARVKSVPRAESLLPLYQTLAPELEPRIIHSSMSQQDQKLVFDVMENRNTRAIICVGMLGEGFDLPNLKVAAIHDHHKSLSVTLQFIGRFTRTVQDVGDAAAIVNIADPKVKEDLQALYAENADWDALLRRASEDTIDREMSLLNLVNSLKDQGDLGNRLSLWNLRPVFSTILYRSDGTVWNPRAFTAVLPRNCNYWHALSMTENVLVVVALRNDEVKWGKYRDLYDQTFELLVAHWDSERNALFLYCSDYDFYRSDTLAKILCGKTTQLVTGNQVFRVFGNVERVMARNLGASKAGVISFTMYFGPNVTEGLSLVDKGQYNLSNITGWGYEDGAKVTWGCSQKKGKIWSIRAGAITEWQEWCRGAWDKITNDSLPETEIINGFLKPELITERHNSCPLSLQWGEHLVSEPEDRTAIIFGDSEHPLYDVDIEIRDYLKTGDLTFRLKTETAESEYALLINDKLDVGYEYQQLSGPKVFIRKGQGKLRSFIEHLSSDPIIFTYVDGSFSYNNYLVKVTEEGQLFDANNLEVWDWTGVNIRKESQGKNREKDTIQYRTCQEFLDDYLIIYDDDASGEAADIIGIRDSGDNELSLGLIHCKFSAKNTPGARLDDFYAVCGQAQKCIRWKHNGFNYLVDHMKRRESKWHDSGFSRFLKGNLADLHRLKRKARQCRLVMEVTIVQPGLGKSSVTPDILRLLASTETYLAKTANAQLRVICSD